MYLVYDSAQNSIEGEGCSHIAAAKWPNLRELLMSAFGFM